MTVSQRACKVWSYYGKVSNQQQLQEWVVGVYFLLLLEQMGTAQSQHLAGAVWIHSHTPACRSLLCPWCPGNSAHLYPAMEGIKIPLSVVTAANLTVQAGLCMLPTPARGSQHLANLSLHHVTSPFTSHFSVHTNGPEHSTYSSPSISFLRCLLT